MRAPIYLDHHATTPVDPRVASVVLRHMLEVYGNASSADHVFGDEAERAVETARQHVATLVGARPRDVTFTAGATESINLALIGLARAHRSRVGRPMRIGLSPVEHRAVLAVCGALADAGEAELFWFPVDRLARIDRDGFTDACRRGLELVCVMAAQNEVGTVYPIAELSEIAARFGVAVFTDATQAAGRVPLAFRDWGLAGMCLSAHKLYGPKGVGVLVTAPQVELQPLLFGGEHERGRRPGTLNVPGIVGMGEACRLRMLEGAADETVIRSRRDLIQRELATAIPDLQVNGDLASRLAGNLHVSVPGIANHAVVARLRGQVALSTGAACTSGAPSPSHVLRAMGLPEESIMGALRLGVGRSTTEDEARWAAAAIAESVATVRGL